MQYKIFLLIILILTINTSSCLAFSKTDDEIYKELIKLDNNGVLPSYINETKNKYDQTYIPLEIKTLSHIEAVEEFNKEITIPDNRMPFPNQKKDWNAILKSVATGFPSAFDINQIKVMTENSNPEATELLAWMYANGIGVKKNLSSSWFLYMKASSLNIENAKENAKKVYDSMSISEKNKLLRF